MGVRFLYFDLGNVLLFFDHRRAAVQLAKAAGADADTVYDFVFRGDLNARCDAGDVDAAEFCDLFRRRFPGPATNAELIRAASDIFRVNPGMKNLLSRLEAAGLRLGLLSNTCDMHYDWFAAPRRYVPIDSAFEVVVLSCRLRRLKPDPTIYLEAARLAEVAPEEVFYVDDLPANVDGARQAGFDAVRYTTPAEYARDLRRRGIRIDF